ncbi:MAG: hypothetical protein M5U35_08980 [Roseovarius sp.]|nr:hypothetical protein [Roseovarius sp.]
MMELSGASGRVARAVRISAAQGSAAQATSCPLTRALMSFSPALKSPPGLRVSVTV